MSPAILIPAVLMGIVEGLTEFLPVSSTGHLILLSEVIGFQGPPGRTFEIGIQLGAILAVVWAYRRDLVQLAAGMWRPGSPEQVVVRNLLLAFLPALVLGATLHGVVTKLLFSPWVVSVALVLGGIALIMIERMRHAATVRSLEALGAGRSVLVGFGQVLAMVPGTSRSGATIAIALLLGMERKAAAEFSFLLAIPTMAAATVYSLWKARAELAVDDLGIIAVGFMTAFVVALATVRAVLRHIGRFGFAPFGWYRIVLGLVMLGWLASR